LKLSDDSEFLSDFGIDVKGEVLLQLSNNSKLRNGTKTYLEQKFFYL